MKKLTGLVIVFGFFLSGFLLLNNNLFVPENYFNSEELTPSEVIKFTNKERISKGLSSLQKNNKLNFSAQEKAEDMLENQYFAHQSLVGKEVDDLVENQNYDYILVGENLALGNFLDEQAIVQNWMNSPPHRESILNPKYQEIGVGMVKGIFETKKVWLVVQHFALPSSACPGPSESLKNQIEIKKNKIQKFQKRLDSLKNEIKNNEVSKIQDYNYLVSQYNRLNKEIENSLNQYNKQVDDYNKCIY